jgi:preprotein translocase subunit YajC
MDTLLTQIPLLLGMPETTAAGTGAAGGQFVSLLVTFGLIIVIFYFLIIRPQGRKQKETKRMLEAIKKGDRVVTVGGMRGTIHSVKDDTIILRVDDAVKLEFNRSAISSVIVPSGGDAQPQAKDRNNRGKGKPEEVASGNGTNAEAADTATETEGAEGEKTKS